MKGRLEKFLQEPFTGDILSRMRTSMLAIHEPITNAVGPGALGVVFGDIGTSPIYAFRESLRAADSVEAQATVRHSVVAGRANLW
jgi:K+ transporter